MSPLTQQEHDTLRVVVLEPTYYDFASCLIEPRDIVKQVQLMRANAIRLGVFDQVGNTYFPSKIAPQAPGLNGRDFLVEMLNACRKENVYLFTYLNNTCDPTCYQQHPDWAKKHPDGTEECWHGFLQVMCLNSPYLDRWTGIVREVAAYEPTGIYIDNFQMLMLCQCKHCQDIVKRDLDIAVPRRIDFENPDFLCYRQWFYANAKERWRQVITAARSVDPAQMVVFNRGALTHQRAQSQGVWQERLAQDADNIHMECALRWYSEELDTRINRVASFGNALGKKPWMWVELQLLPWTHVGAPAAELTLKAAKVVCNNAVPTAWTLNNHPQGIREAAAGLEPVFSLIEDHPEMFTGWRNTANVGLLYSRSTLEWYGREDSMTRAERFYHGMFAGLQRAGVPFKTILDETRDPVGLEQFRVVVLPHTACLSKQTADVLRDFVQDGGCLFATGPVGCYDEKGRARKESVLAEVLGVSFEGTNRNADGGYASLAGRGPIDLGTEGTFLPLAGRLYDVKPTGASVLAYLVKPPRYYAAPAEATTDRGVLFAHSFGQGHVLYSASELELAELPETPHSLGSLVEFPPRNWFPGTLSDILRPAIKQLTNDNLPLQLIPHLPDLEANLWARGQDRLILTLVNCNVNPSGPITHIQPTSSFSVETKMMDQSFRRVYSLRGKIPIPYKCTEEGLRLEIAGVSIFDIIILERTET